MTVTQPTQHTSEGATETRVAGIVALQGGRGILRMQGYRPHPDDVRIPSGQLLRHDLRPGDEITGIANPHNRTLLRVETLHGLPPERVKRRPDFAQLAATHPDRRLRLETEPHVLTTRVIDLVMPVGKGQRALIV